jgi:hypothetical protein
LRIQIRVDLHHFGKLDPYPDPRQNEKQDLDSHQSEKVEALEGHFGALEGPNLKEVLGFRIRIKLKVFFSPSVWSWWRSRGSSSLPWRSSIQPPTATIMIDSGLLLVIRPYSSALFHVCFPL